MIPGMLIVLLFGGQAYVPNAFARSVAEPACSWRLSFQGSHYTQAFLALCDDGLRVSFGALPEQLRPRPADGSVEKELETIAGDLRRLVPAAEPCGRLAQISLHSPNRPKEERFALCEERDDAQIGSRVRLLSAHLYAASAKPR